MDYNELYDCIKNNARYSKYLYIDMMIRLLPGIEPTCGIINNYYNDLTKCKNINDMTNYFTNIKHNLRFVVNDHGFKEITHCENDHVIHGAKIVKLLNYLKGDKYWINNDIFYNDFAYDLDNLITLINRGEHELTPDTKNEILELYMCLFQIYSEVDETLRIFKNKLINKIIFQ
jgi:hypothetical protein